jgi:hypothetical protein
VAFDFANSYVSPGNTDKINMAVGDKKGRSLDRKGRSICIYRSMEHGVMTEESSERTRLICPYHMKVASVPVWHKPVDGVESGLWRRELWGGLAMPFPIQSAISSIEVQRVGSSLTCDDPQSNRILSRLHTSASASASTI